MPERIVVGRIVKPHGIRGEVIVEAQTEVPGERFVAGSRFYLGEPADPLAKAARIEQARPHQGRFIVTFAHVRDRDAAEALRNTLLSIPAEEARPLEPGRYYPHELKGFDVVDENGEALGVMGAVLENPANDLWVVTTPDGKDVLVPAVKEFVTNVDPENRRIVIRPIPGLFTDED